MSGANATHPVSYEELVASKAFLDDLGALNATISNALKAAKADQKIWGNLLYPHGCRDFVTALLDPDSEEKRQRWVEVVGRGRTLVEVGVNGGHSLLLAKHANPALKCIGIDICANFGQDMPRTDIYVPAAMAWLTDRFPGDMEFRIGDSRIVAPTLTVELSGEKIDIVHIDGHKPFYLQDVINLFPTLHHNSLIVIDDSNLPEVKNCIRVLIRSGLARRNPEFSGISFSKQRHAVLNPSDRYTRSLETTFLDPLKRASRKVLPVDRIRHIAQGLSRRMAK